MEKNEKVKAITALKRKQLKLVEKAIKIAKKKPTKSIETSFARAAKIISLAMKANQLQHQMDIIAAQIAFDFPKGGIKSGEDLLNE